MDTLLDAQTRPSFIAEACKVHGVEDYSIILFDCSDEVRRSRLVARGQPELANEQMMDWAMYLRDACQGEKCSIIDTTKLTIEQSVDSVISAIGRE